MAHDRSFTVDDSENVTDRRDDGHSFSAVSAGETAGRPAGRVLNRLLDERAGASTGPDPPSLRPRIEGDGPLTVVVVRDPRPLSETESGVHAIHTVGRTSHFVSPSPYAQVLEDLEPHLLGPDTSSADRLMHDAARQGVLREAGVHSVIIAPLPIRGRLLGPAGHRHRTRAPCDPAYRRHSHGAPHARSGTDHRGVRRSHHITAPAPRAGPGRGRAGSSDRRPSRRSVGNPLHARRRSHLGRGGA